MTNSGLLPGAGWSNMAVFKAIKTRQKYRFLLYSSFIIMLNFRLNTCNRLRNSILWCNFALFIDENSYNHLK